MAGSLRGKTFVFPSNDTPEEVTSILQIDGIESVYAMATALTINKKPSAKWENLLPLVLKPLVGNDDVKTHEKLLQGLLVTNAASSSSTSETAAGQVRMRMQISNKIPIQIEGTGSLGTVQRLKLPPKFQEYMELMQKGGIDFFAGRTWMDRGLRYQPDVEDDNDCDERSGLTTFSPEEQERLELESVLQTEMEEVDAAYPSHRLANIVSESLGEKNQKQEETIMEREDVSLLQLDLETVDRYCDLAEGGDFEALEVLANFVSSHQGLLAARRNALCYLGGTGGDGTAAKSDLVLNAVVSAIQNEKNPIMRRTAGDALSDLGDKRAVPHAVTALEGDRSKLVQWRAARILGELADSLEVVAVLKQASFSSNFAFEVAFEIKDALRKVQARVRDMNGNSNSVETKTGPIWKQIQEGASSFAADKDMK
eukprot:CAMPEP_0195522982 /NCGR_PEP_ID=MMETSP0794_2-20130614/21675_1 /TAXON_ID=515487 /ORGANISM="Stephanopyxis turris, Strain CCMP 815" /LENGTH=425 /DNA_ID=CAMNT_0040652871 /DNA_START=371 /DNA_END=1648 /DNA_ORIENTATION=+